MKLSLNFEQEKGTSVPITYVNEGHTRPLNGTVRVTNFSGHFVQDVTFEQGRVTIVRDVKGFDSSHRVDLDAVNYYLALWPEASISRCLSAGGYDTSIDDAEAWEAMAMGDWR